MAILTIVMTSDTRANQFCLGHKLPQNLPSKSPVYSRVTEGCLLVTLSQGSY